MRVALAALVLAVAALPAGAAPPDPAALDQGGEIAYRRALQPAATERRLNADRGVAARVRSVTNRILASAPDLDPAARALSWTVNVVTEPSADVLVYPGGRLLVHSGLVAAGLSDEELGALVAHALSHALLGHDRERLGAMVPAAEAGAADPNRRALAVANAAAEATKQRYTDAMVAAADRASVALLARAAYSPKAAASAWRRLPADAPLARRSAVTDARLAALESAAEHAMPLFEETRAKAAEMPRPEKPATPGGSRSIR
jgi:predicted Zn-dependent protease